MRHQLVGLLAVLLVFLMCTAIAESQATSQVGTPTPVPTSTAAPTQTPLVVEVRERPKSLSEQYGPVLVAAVVGAFLALAFNRLLGPTFTDWGRQLNEWRKGASNRFREKYIPAIAEEHRYLKLVGVYGREELPRPSLEEVYVTLQIGSTDEVTAALYQGLTIGQALSEHKRLLILGEPGAGKSTLLDYLTLVFCGELRALRLTRLGDLLPIYLPLRRCVADDRPL